MAAVTGPAHGKLRLVQVVPSLASRMPGDEPRDVDPAAVAVEERSPGRVAVHAGDGRVVWAAVGIDHPPGPVRPRTIEVVVDGWRFELEVEDMARASLRARATRAETAGPDSGRFEVRAMIPGRVAAVVVATGDVVKAGQTLVVVEAMKMQNELRAPRDGMVERVSVGVGETIDLGDVLVVLA